MSAVAQPIQLNFVARNGRSYTYTPDFLVRFHSHTRQSPMLVEVKPEENWLLALIEN